MYAAPSIKIAVHFSPTFYYCLLPRSICSPTDQMEAPSTSYVQFKTKSICSQLAAPRGIAAAVTPSQSQRTTLQWPAPAGLATEIGGGRRGELAWEGGASCLGAGREAWPRGRGIHPTVVGRLAT
jgi:hypothetical protein